MRAAFEQSKILLARQEIEDALKDESVSPEEKQKLKVVLAAREYAQSMGLNPGGSFTKYADIGKDTLAWVLVAARKDSFSLHSWWFPIVGRVPYKGYFDKEDALEAGRDLEAEGYEAFVRGTDAFSTLGWFNDPVLSTTLQGPPYRIANTVIHESVHSTVWIKGSVPFNESLANFIGNEGAVLFYGAWQQRCVVGKSCSDDEVQQVTSELARAQRDRAYQFEVAELIDALYGELDALYQRSDISSDQKILEREVVFAKHLDPFKAKYPELKALQKINNAEIIQLKLYLSRLDLFERLFVLTNRDWTAFTDKVKGIAAQVDEDSGRDPFTELKKLVGVEE
jgi:predicted aminopeptidase